MILLLFQMTLLIKENLSDIRYEIMIIGNAFHNFKTLH